MHRIGWLTEEKPGGRHHAQVVDEIFDRLGDGVVARGARVVLLPLVQRALVAGDL